MKQRIVVGMLLLLMVLSARADEGAMARFIDRLMARMTLEEKLGQLNLLTQSDFVTGEARNSGFEAKLRQGRVGGVLNMLGAARIREVQRVAVEETRLGIPLLFGFDVIHGYKTIFPIPLALSASWNPDMIERAAATAVREGSAAGVNWVYSPMVDICRDARWGRIAEGAGEDPYLGALVAQAMVRGIQGDGLYRGTDKVLACVKHYGLYGGAEAGLDYSRADMSRHTMYNDYFLPYKAAVEAGAASMMASFNDVEGVPATANRWLMTDVLRHEWGFGGFVASDYTGVSEMVAHGIGSLPEVAAKAITAGVDMDMVSESYINTLPKQIAAGRVSISDVDVACRRILEAKYRLGLFADPYKYCDTEREATLLYTDENLAQAEEAARQSFVLLKNADNVLPLKGTKRVALIGPLADSHGELLGSWSARGDWRLTPSLRDELTARLGPDRLLYAKGCNIYYSEQLNRNAQYPEIDSRPAEAMVAEALRVARKADVVVAAMGEAANMSGESASRTSLDMPDAQRDLLQRLVALGKPVVLVLYNGRPMSVKWEHDHVASILDVWFAGSRGARAIVSTLYGDHNPSGRLTCTFPQTVGQEPLYYNHKSSGRPLAPGRWFAKYRNNYIDLDNQPLYPFGYGLSYTTYEYGPLTLSAHEMRADESIRASVVVTNTGPRDGDEVVQLYLRDEQASVTRPVQELKDFRRIHLKAGQSAEVEFTIDAAKLKFYNQAFEFVAEPGDFELQVGSNCRDVQTAKFKLK